MTKTDVENLQNIQRHLKRKGFKLSQQKLLGRIVEYISENELDFIENIKEKRKSKDKDILDDWLDKQVEGEPSDAVSEHDEVN
jgi:hypothetical protein